MENLSGTVKYFKEGSEMDEIKELLEQAKCGIEMGNDFDYETNYRIVHFLGSIAHSLLAIAQLLADIEFKKEK